MKPIFTVLAACALLLVPATALADTLFTWDAGAADDDWCSDSNWDIAYCPNSSSESALIEDGASWPVLGDNYTAENDNQNINSLTMRDDAELSTSYGEYDFELECATFTVSPNGEAADVLIYGGGLIDTDSLTVQASDSYNATLTVSASMTAGTVTIQGATSQTATLTVSSGSVSTD